MPDANSFVIHWVPAVNSKKVKSFVKGHVALLFLSEVHIVLSKLPDKSVLWVRIHMVTSVGAGGASPSTSASLGARVFKCDDETGTVSALGAICGCPGR